MMYRGRVDRVFCDSIVRALTAIPAACDDCFEVPNPGVDASDWMMNSRCTNVPMGRLKLQVIFPQKCRFLTEISFGSRDRRVEG